MTTRGQPGHRRGIMRGGVRPLLLWGVPAAMVVAGVWIYLSLGRYASTDDAYVQADKSVVAPQVSGNILKINVRENEQVNSGQVLLEVEDEAARLAVQRAQAQLEAARTNVEALKANYVLQSAEVAVAENQARFAQAEFERQKDLARKKLASQSDLDKAEQNYEQMHGLSLIIRGQMHETAIRLSGNPDLAVNDHPEVRAAAADLQRAELDLDRARLLAPRAGIVSRVPHVGDHLTAGVPALAIVDDSREWIEANFKETDLTRMHPGQSVDIDIDTYPDYQWHGHIESIAQATGAEFALLPPQNASGNWVKVVQRIPVRISIDADEGAPALRVGMSATVRVDLGPREKVSTASQAR